MNLNLRLLAACKTTVVACAMIIASLSVSPSARAQAIIATNALQFSNGGVVTLGQPDLAPPWTVNLWVNRSNAPGSSAVLFNSPTAGLKLEQFGSPNRNVGITLYGVQDYNFNYTVPVGVWTHLAFTCDGTNVTLYTNGVVADNVQVSISLPLNQFGSSTVDLLNATVDEVAVYSKALTSTQISSNYLSWTAARRWQNNLPVAPLLIWHCDEPSGAIVMDSSISAHNNGTLNGVARVPSYAPIYSPTITVPAGQSLSPLPLAVRFANGGGNVIINFATNYTGEEYGSEELSITNDMTIDASSLAVPPTFNAGSANRHFSIASNVNFTLSGVILQGGLAPATYPAIALGGSISNSGNLTLNQVVFTQNQAIGPNPNIVGGQIAQTGADAGGGAIYNSAAGTLTLNQCTFTQNAVTGGTGLRGGGTGYGAAIYNSGALVANFSSFYGQTNTGGLADEVFDNKSTLGSALGGVVYNDVNATATFNQCTLANNLVTITGSAARGGNGFGGAIYSLGVLNIRQSTLAGNMISVSQGSSGGGSVYQTGSATVLNSIIGPDNVQQQLGVYSSRGNNLIDANPRFAPLDNYGGPTLTMPLMAGSPGIDGVVDLAFVFFLHDQRGFPRLFGGHVDIGAVESTPPLLIPGAITITKTNTATGNYVVQFQVAVNPNGAPSALSFLYGQLPYTAGTQIFLSGSVTNINTSFTINLSRGYTTHYTFSATNLMGSTTIGDATFTTPRFSTDIAGDLDGDGVVSQGELTQVYSNYLATSPYLLITNTTGLGQSNLVFAISNGLIGSYTVQSSTDLINWTNLGPASPVFNFQDTNTPASSKFYRLVYP